MRFCFFTLLCLLSLSATAGVMPDKSRIIYRETSSLEAIMLVNTNAYPVMVQLWVDDGELHSVPENASAPFVVTPVMFKLGAGQMNGIKAIYAGEKNQLPPDRESLFWLNILEVPPKPNSAPGEEKIALSMLTQLKVLYRPRAIDLNAEEVVKKMAELTFKLDSKSDAYYVTIANPTPFVASFASLALSGQQKGKKLTIVADTDIDLLVPPFSSQTFRFSPRTGNKAVRIEKIDYALVDDAGRYLTMQRKLSS